MCSSSSLHAAALYAYHDEPFDTFEDRVLALLRRGFVWGIAQKTLFSSETPRILGTMLTAGVAAHAGILIGGAAKLAATCGADADAMQKLAVVLRLRFAGPIAVRRPSSVICASSMARLRTIR